MLLIERRVGMGVSNVGEAQKYRGAEQGLHGKFCNISYVDFRN